MAPERTAEQAHARMDLHEAVCSERYKNVDHKLGELKAMLLAQGSDVHQRLNAISTRMWVAVTGSLGFTAAALASLVVYLLTKGK